MKIAILQHGQNYFTKGEPILCPECNASEGSIKIHVFDTHLLCKCKICDCSFKIKRDEDD